MAFITRLANALRIKNQWNLFCILELGDKGPVYVFESGTGSRTKNILDGIRVTGIERAKFARVWPDKSADAEERMVFVFEDLWAESGYPKDITIITAASPCVTKCAPAINALAKKLKGKIKTWTILFHAPYSPDIKGGHSGEQRLLNFVDGDLQVTCSQLHASFIDADTLH